MKLLLRYGVSPSEFIELVKRAYVAVAEEEKEFHIDRKKQTTARISVLTGLNRKEVSRIQSLKSENDTTPATSNRAAQVVNGWIRDTEYLDENSEPRDLYVSEGDTNFTDLVKRYSGDMPVRAIMDELIKVGAVSKLETGQLHLCCKAYIPQSSDVEKFELLGVAASDLFKTLEHNIPRSLEDTRLQLTLAYNNLPKEALEEFKKLSETHAHETLIKLNEWLSTNDRCVNPDVKGTGKYRAGLGIYYFEEEN